MSYKTDKTVLVDRKDFYFGTSNYDKTTLPSNEVKITASDGAAYDYFGWSVAAGSGRIVVSARGDDDNGSSSGSAYIFDLDGNQLAKITASDAAASDFFGGSIAVGSGKIVVGAYQDDDNGSNSGSAYIFDLDGNELTKITASDGAAADRFGISVAVGSARIVVGAYNHNSAAGAAYIFDLDGNELAKITASDGAANDFFGISVAVGSGRIVVGARGDDDNGSAYIFDLDGNELTKITASDGAADDRFGYSVAVGSGKIVIGARLDDDNGSDSGSAYIFDLDGNQLAKIKASDAAAGDWFGESVAVGSGRIVVGAYRNDDNGSDSGSAYIFDLDGNELTKITASDAAASDFFGESVVIGSGRVVVGAYWDDDNGSFSGSAYIYTTPNQTHAMDVDKIVDSHVLGLDTAITAIDFTDITEEDTSIGITNTQMISGINTKVSLEVTFDQQDDPYTLTAYVNGAIAAGPTGSPGTLNFDVENFDTLYFQVEVGNDARAQDSTVTITNKSNLDTVVDTFLIVEVDNRN